MKTLLTLIAIYAVLLFGSQALLAQIEWTEVSDQPVLDYGAPGEWDAAAVLRPKVIKDGDTLRIWYSGTATSGIVDGYMKIGYAWSLDGIEWHRLAQNPVLTPDLSWENGHVGVGAVIKDGDMFKMWYNAGWSTGKIIGYATSLDGIHWNKHPDPVLERGPLDDWDEGYIEATSVIKEGDTYKLWYWGGTNVYIAESIEQIGYATSTDGIHWIKHNDPLTSESPFSDSDPVLSVGGSGDWDAHRIWSPSILAINNVYELWYTGTSSTTDLNDRLGYAISPDGIEWSKWQSNPVKFTNSFPTWGAGYTPDTVLKFDGQYHLWYARYTLEGGDHRARIGYATSPVMEPFVFYSHHSLDDSLGNHNGRADAGERVNLIVTLYNLGIAATGISATIATENPDVQLINATASFGDPGSRQPVSNQDNPFSFSVSETSCAHVDTFSLHITSNDGKEWNDSFEIVIGTSKVILIDDDAGSSYECYYKIHLQENGLLPLDWKISQKGCPSVDLFPCNEEVVIWFTGDDREKTLTSEEQATIAALLDSGGKLLLTGQNIGYDLVENGTASDSAFYANYLHADYISDSANVVWVMGISGDPISGGIRGLFSGKYIGADNQTSLDAISIISPAEQIFKYTPDGASAGLRYENETTGAKLVYLAFGLEGITGPYEHSASEMLDRILHWFGDSGPSSVNANEECEMPACFALNQNFPNPFNPETVIRYQLPEAGLVELELYNLLGQRIRTLVNQRQPAGIHQLVWDGRSDSGKMVPTGIYFYQLRSGTFSATKKMLLMQ